LDRFTAYFFSQVDLSGKGYRQAQDGDQEENGAEENQQDNAHRELRSFSRPFTNT